MHFQKEEVKQKSFGRLPSRGWSGTRLPENPNRKYYYPKLPEANFQHRVIPETEPKLKELPAGTRKNFFDQKSNEFIEKLKTILECKPILTSIWPIFSMKNAIFASKLIFCAKNST